MMITVFTFKHREGEGVTIDRRREDKDNKWFMYPCRPAVQHKSQMRKVMSDVYDMFALNKGMSFCTI